MPENCIQLMDTISILFILTHVKCVCLLLHTLEIVTLISPGVVILSCLKKNYIVIYKVLQTSLKFSVNISLCGAVVYSMNTNLWLHI